MIELYGMKILKNESRQNPKQNTEFETKRKETNRKIIIKMGTTGYERCHAEEEGRTWVETEEKNLWKDSYR
jgi:hypothetical protein